jgi:hypothetical protein
MAIGSRHLASYSFVLLLNSFVRVTGFSPSINIALSKNPVSFRTCSSSSLKMSNNNRIVVVGSANQDLTSNTNILPTLGETVMASGDFQTACGGKGANQAVAAACLQMAPVSMVCRVGDDIFGQNLLANFRK